MREAKFLKRMGFDIPSSAKIVLTLQDSFKSYFIKIKNICAMYNSMLASIKYDFIVDIIQPHRSALSAIMEPGLSRVTWQSMSVEKYVNECNDGIQRLWTLIKHINDILENRVQSNFDLIASTSLLHSSTTDSSFTYKSFQSFQKKPSIKRKRC
jgi:dynein heavy chain